MLESMERVPLRAAFCRVLARDEVDHNGEPIVKAGQSLTAERIGFLYIAGVEAVWCRREWTGQAPGV